jgi:hypothetical protein
LPEAAITSSAMKIDGSIGFDIYFGRPHPVYPNLMKNTEKSRAHPFMGVRDRLFGVSPS